MFDIVGVTIFEITSTNLYVPIVSLSTKDNVSLTKQLHEGFKRSVYWNEYKSKIETKSLLDNDNITRFLMMFLFKDLIDSLLLLLIILMVMPIKLKKTVLTDGRNFYDQPINDLIKQYDEIRNIATGKGDDYTTGCLLDYQYFKNHYKLIAVDLIKQI